MKMLSLGFAPVLAFWIISYGSATEPAKISEMIDRELHQMLVSRRNA